jgi:hypothetical protein
MLAEGAPPMLMCARLIEIPVFPGIITCTASCTAQRSIDQLYSQLGTRWNKHSYLQLTMMDAQQQIGCAFVSVLVCMELSIVAALLTLIDWCSVHLHAESVNMMTVCVQHEW